MAEPLQVETREQGLIYSAERSAYYAAWQTVFRPSAVAAAINISIAGSHTIITGKSKHHIKILSLYFTVAGQVDVTLYDGAVAISGPMDFGGTDEPRGIVIPFPFSPLELSEGNAFGIGISANFKLAGSVCYYYQ